MQSMENGSTIQVRGVLSTRCYLIGMSPPKNCSLWMFNLFSTLNEYELLIPVKLEVLLTIKNLFLRSHAARRVPEALSE